MSKSRPRITRQVLRGLEKLAAHCEEGWMQDPDIVAAAAYVRALRQARGPEEGT